MRLGTAADGVLPILALLALAACAVAQPTDALEQGFSNPPSSAKPHTWWHWMNGNVTREGITADLEAMARVGVGGAQIFDVTDGILPGPVDYAGEKWRAMVKHAITEADRLGIEICMHNCAGWSSSGGPWVTPELAMQMVVTSELKAAGPAHLDEVLKQPETRVGYYKDIAVLAFPTPGAETSAAAVQTPTLSASLDSIDVARVMDGDPSTTCVIPLRSREQTQYIELSYTEPFTARSLVLHRPGGRQGTRCELLVSADGQEFTRVAAFSIPEPGVARAPYTVNFDPVTGRAFRLAFPASGAWGTAAVGELELQSGFRVGNLSAKAGYSRGNDPAPDRREVPAEACIPVEQVLDITTSMAADGRLQWDVPAGDWTILRLGHTPTGKDNHPAPEPGRGLETDKLSREATEMHFQALLGKVIADVGPLAGKTLNNSLIDSYEVDCQNWTPLMRREFTARRGYDPLPYLPALTGRVVDDPATTERFLWDYRRTLADLFHDNYFGRFAELCHEHGMMMSVEPYGNGNFEDITAGSKGDIPMGEFWAGAGGWLGAGKLPASAAHLYGRRFVGAEAFTANPENGGWRNHPGNMKQLGDLMYCSGINRFIFHRYCHQPWMDLLPGMTMGPHGFHFERTSTWFDESPTWLSYLTRCQYLLQEGLFVGDLLYYIGEGAPQSLPGRESLRPAPPAGYDYDGCNTEALLTRVSVEDGRIVLPDGMSYRLLVLPEKQTMTPTTLARVRDLIAAGATVIGPRPQSSPGLQGYPACDEEVRALAREIWGDCDGKTVTEHGLGRGMVIWGRPLEEVLAAIDLPPAFEYKGTHTSTRLVHIHRRANGAEVFFISNQSPRSEYVDCTFRVGGRVPELWHPETGSTEEAPVYVESDGRTTVSLRFEPAGSVFVVFRRASEGRDPVVAVSCDGRPLSEWKPAWTPELEIVSAVYGAFTVEESGFVDVTEHLRKLVREYKLTVVASNSIAGDPANQVVKQMRVDYTIGGRNLTRTVDENRTLTIPEGDDPTEGPLLIRRALYGILPEDPDAEPPTQTVDVTEVLRDQVEDGSLLIRADNSMAGDPAPLIVKQLRVQYALDGQTYHKTVAENAILALPDYTESVAAVHDTPPAELHLNESGAPVLTAWAAGEYSALTASGARRSVTVGEIPAQVAVTGPWQVAFQPDRGAPANATFPQLASYTTSEDPGIRHFSGTATYTKTIEVPAALVAAGTVLCLDLGTVREMARVRLNGRDLGLLWRAPFRADVTGAVRAGSNELQLEVTNLWMNRIIGDEQLPPDCEWSGSALKAWPRWLLEGGPRPETGRVTFTTWRHYTAESPLPEAGLLGPVMLRAGRQVPLAAR